MPREINCCCNDTDHSSLKDFLRNYNDDILYNPRSRGRTSLSEHDRQINSKYGLIISHDLVKRFEDKRDERDAGKVSHFLLTIFCPLCDKVISVDQFNENYMKNRKNNKFLRTSCPACGFVEVCRLCVVC